MAVEVPAKLPAERQPLKAYISYSHRDRQIVEKILEYLRPLELEGELEVFSDQALAAGSEWDKELQQHLFESDIVLFLVSPDAVTSSYISREVALAVENRQTGSGRERAIVPVILRPCDWFGSPLGRFQALPSNAKPVTEWSRRDEAYLSIADGIRQLVVSMRQREMSTVQSKHAGRVHRIAVTPDGRFVITASEDRTAIVWDASTLRARFTLAGHTDVVTDVDVTPDGKLAVTGSRDFALKVWHLKTGRLLREMQGIGAIIAVTIIPDGTIAVSASDTGYINAWAVATGRDASSTMAAFPGGLCDVAAVPGVPMAAVAFMNGSLAFWDVRHLGQLGVLDRAEEFESTMQVAVAMDGSLIAAATDRGFIWVWTIAASPLSRRSFQVSQAALTGIALVPDGRHVVSSSTDGKLRLHDVIEGTEIRSFDCTPEMPTAVAVLPDGSRVIWGSANGSISSWALDTTSVLSLPVGVERLELAYLAVLENPELWPVLESWDESALLGIRSQLQLAPDENVLDVLKRRHPNAAPPPLWSAWMQIVNKSKLGAPPEV